MFLFVSLSQSHSFAMKSKRKLKQLLKWYISLCMQCKAAVLTSASSIAFPSVALVSMVFVCHVSGIPNSLFAVFWKPILRSVVFRFLLHVISRSVIPRLPFRWLPSLPPIFLSSMCLSPSQYVQLPRDIQAYSGLVPVTNQVKVLWFGTHPNHVTYFETLLLLCY